MANLINLLLIGLAIVGSSTAFNCNCTTTGIEKVIALSREGQYNYARYELSKLGNYESEMHSIVSQLYNGSMEDANHCLHLFNNLPCEVSSEGVEALCKQMEEHEKLSELQVLPFSLLLLSSSCDNSTKFQTTKSLVMPHLDAILDRWSEDIQQGAYQDIYKFVELGDIETESVTLQMGKLIEKVYEALPNAFSTTLAFIFNLPVVQPKIPGYQAIIEELKAQEKQHSEEMLTVSYHIYLEMSTIAETFANVPDLQDWHAMLGNLAVTLPSDIRNLIWGSNCSIKNVHYNEYLHAAEDLLGGSGNVFTLISGEKLNAGDWILLPGHTGAGNIYFIVKNNHLRSDYSYLCESRRTSMIVTCQPGEDGWLQWYIKPTYVDNKDNGTLEFQIKNSAFDASTQDDYLQSTSNLLDITSRQREVKDSSIGDSGHWEIDCV